MPTREGFLHTINTNPTDPNPHAVYADWLEDQGDLQESLEHRKLYYELHCQQSPLDYSRRRTFADWCDQNDFPVEADRQRQYEIADRWMRNISNTCGQTCSNYDETWDAYRTRTQGLSYSNPEQREQIQEISDELRNQEQWVDISREDLIQAGRTFKETGDSLVQQGIEDLRNMLCTKEQGALYWRYWSILTGEEPPVPHEFDDEAPFSCSC